MIDTSKVTRYGQRLDFEEYPVGEVYPMPDGRWIAKPDYDALAAENAEMKKLLWGARQSEVVTRAMRAVWGLKYTQEIDALLGEEK
jgi:hypothetical protein